MREVNFGRYTRVFHVDAALWIVIGVWLLYAATDLQVQTLASPLTVGAETAARKMPIFSTMLEQVIEKAPAQASRMLLNFKEVNWHAMNSFVHSGIHPL
ncbi:hypothetical protein EGV01_30575, partial [Pseudomonas syringae pv. theae]|nr:hypothetical protein [Pseudomonas syringae pv. theae]